MLTLTACRKATISASPTLGLPLPPDDYPLSTVDCSSNGQVTLFCPIRHKEKSTRMILNQVLTPTRELQEKTVSSLSLGGLGLDVTPGTAAAILQFKDEATSNSDSAEGWKKPGSVFINQSRNPQNSRLPVQ